MRTKTLLVAAVLGLATAASSMAQTYSVNAVGFVNKSIPPGFSIMVNPLSNGDNTVKTVLPTVPPGTKIYKYDTSLNPPDYVDSTFSFGNWTKPTVTIAPGEAFFILNSGSSAAPVTFVGEVPQNTLTISLKGGFNLVGSKAPQKLPLSDKDNPADPTNDLGYTPTAGDIVYFYRELVAGSGNRDYVKYSLTFGNWSKSNDPNNLYEALPTPDVGEGFWLAVNADKVWTRNFTVN